MAKAALENALWDAEATQKQLPLWKLLGGTRREIPCGVSIGIQDSVEQLLEKIQIELAAGYRRIKIKVKPGWDVNVLERIRSRWADITLSCDANSAYTLDQVEHLRKFDQFNLLMIEQPLWNDDIYYHARLQKELRTSICLDESIVSVRSAAFAVETECVPHHQRQSRPRRRILRSPEDSRPLPSAQHSGLVRRHARNRHRAGAQHRALDACRTSACPAMSPPRSATGKKTSSIRKWKSRRRE